MKHLILIAALPLYAQLQRTQFDVIPYPSGTRGVLRFYENRASGNNHIQFRSPSSLTANFDLDWPTPTANAIWYTRAGAAAVDNSTSLCFDAANQRLGITTCSPAFTIDAGSGAISAGNIRPSADDTHSGGTSGLRYANWFLHRLTISSGAGQGVASALVPNADNVFTLGLSDRRWLEGHFGLNSDAVNLWRSTDLANSRVAFKVSGSGTGIWSLGAASSGLFTLARDGASIASWTTNGLYETFNGIRPSDDGLQSSGAAGRRWNFTWTNSIVLGTGASQGFGSDATPDSDATRNLGGGPSRRWNNVFAVRNQMYSTAGTPSGFYGYNSSSQLRFFMGDGVAQGGGLELYDNTGALKFGITGDVLTIGGLLTIAGGLRPDVTNTRDIASSGTQYRRIHAQTFVSSGTLGITGSCAGTVVYTGGIVTGCL